MFLTQFLSVMLSCSHCAECAYW